MIYDVVIIGGGVSAFAAAMYAGRFTMKTLVIGETMGGTIILTDVVENYPGFKKLTGMELANNIADHAKEYGIEIENDKVTIAKRINSHLFELETQSGKKFRCKSVIIATGTHWKKLNVQGEQEYANKGVHYCALCDGAFYRNKVIGVVGGGDSAVKEALLLSTYGSHVYMFVRGEKTRPEPVNGKKLEKNEKITVFTKVNVTEVKGDGKKMNSVVFDREINGSQSFPLDALFIEIGHLPLSEIAVQLGVELNAKKEIPINRLSETNVPGIYAAGDVVDTKFKQAITGVAEGVTAAYSAYQHVQNEEVLPTGE